MLAGLAQLFFGELTGRGIRASSLVWGVILLGGQLWLHFREQMVDTRQRLTPKFSWPHIAFFLMSSVFLFGACALLLLQSASLEVPETMGLLLLIFGYIGCCAATQIRILPYLGLGAIVWALVSAIPAPHPPIPTDIPAIKLLVAHLGVTPCFGVIAALGFAASLGAITWMDRITEEQWGYVKPSGFNLFTWFNNSTGRFAGCRPGPAKIRRNAANADDGIPAALRRWRRADIPSTGLMLAPVPIAIVVLISLALMRKTHGEVILGLQLATPFLAVLPSLLAASQWMKRWPFMEMESSRPANRVQFTKGIFVATAAQTLGAWLAFTGTAAAIVMIDGAGLNALLHLAPYYIAALLAQPLAYAVCCWIISYPRLAGVYAAGAAVVEYEVALNFWNEGMRTFLTIASASTILGLILIPVIYRRWLNLEMG
jgi:hypothetical protein